MSYREWNKVQGPGWTQDTNGNAFSGETGAVLDEQRDRLLHGVLSRFPTKGALDPSTGRQTLAPSDALDSIGSDRKLRRGLGESDASYAAREQAAWDAWELAASPYSVLRALTIAGYVDPIWVQQNGRWARLTGSTGTLADLSLGSLMACITRSSHPGWMFDWRDDFWATFGLVFENDATNLQTEEGQFTLNSIVKDWQPARAFAGTWVILAGGLFGWPTGQTWGAASNWGGDSERYILPDAWGA